MNLAITYRRSGDPTEVLDVTDIGEPPPPAPGQVQVQVSAFPIHPGDLLAVSAAQTSGRELVAGIEATGVITEVGAGVASVSARDLLSALSPGGTLIIYGALAQEPIPLHAATVLHSALGIRGLTINRWLAAVSPEQRASDVASAVTITTGFPHHFDVAAIYPLDRIADAVHHMSQPGKVSTVVVKP